MRPTGFNVAQCRINSGNPRLFDSASLGYSLWDYPGRAGHEFDYGNCSVLLRPFGNLSKLCARGLSIGHLWRVLWCVSGS